MASLEIPAAKLLSRRSHVQPGALLVTELFFEVPLDYAAPAGSASIQIFGRAVTKHEVPVADSDDDGEEGEDPKSGKGKKKKHTPYLVYLEGGPGYGCREPQSYPLTRLALAKGYQVLYLDHRGVGLSTPVSAAMLANLGDADAQVNYLRLMRQDNTVRDCEAVRKCLAAADLPSGLTARQLARRSRWSIIGQSYGGFVSLSYLSMHPEGLREVFLTGGLAPVGRSADEVYAGTFRRVAKRNRDYYAKFPEDVDIVRQLAAYIKDVGGAVPLPGGGSLTLQRLLTLGMAFGFHGGFDTVHGTLLALKSGLDQSGVLSRASLVLLEQATPFDTAPIFALLHEPIYCDGPGSTSNWAAYRVGKDIDAFSWLKPDFSLDSVPEDQPLFFSGENVFPFHFDTYPELMALKEVGHKIAALDDWPALYDQDQLRRNEVPVYAASYPEDMYVDHDFAKETAAMVKGTKTFENNLMFHNASRTKADAVMHNLFALRDDIVG